MLLRF
jgi:hypothetical protein